MLFYEMPVDSSVVVEFRVEGSDELPSLRCCHNMAIHNREDFYILSS